MTAREAAEFEKLFQQARAANVVNDKVELLEHAVAIDRQHAGASFLLGHAYLDQDRPAEAREQFIRAKHELHDALRTVAESSATPLIDVRRDFETRTTDGIPGDSFFLV